MAEDKKTHDEKRYAILTRESIRLCAEAGGHGDVAEDVCGMLGEDVSYRLRAIAQIAAQFMRHSRRKRMTTEDLNKALRNMDVQPVLGHGSLDPLTFQQTREGEIHFVEDQDVNFANIATSNYVPNYNGNTSIKSHWLALEGVQKSVSSQQNLAQPGKTAIKPVQKPVTEDHLLYYDNITKAILGFDEHLAKVALDDLKTNSKIVPLLPYFVNFVSNGVKTISYDIKQLTKLLHTVSSVAFNPHLYLEPKPYLTLLVEAVMYCILEPLAASINPLNDHWVLRDHAARLITQIIRRWHTPVNQLLQTTLRTLKDALHDLTKPTCSHYGAVMGLLSLGDKAIEDILVPYLPTFWPHLQSILEDSPVNNTLAKSDAHKLHGAILLAVEFLIKKKLKDFEKECSARTLNVNGCEDVINTLNVNGCENVIKKEEFYHVPVKQENGRGHRSNVNQPAEQNVCEFYKNMYEFFGDSLAMRLPKLNLQHIFKAKKKDDIVEVMGCEMEVKTGEELLDDFMEQVRLQQIQEEKERKIRQERERLEAKEREKVLQRQLELRKQEDLRRKQESEIRRQQRERYQPAGKHSYGELSEQEEDVDVEEMSDYYPESEKSDKSDDESAYQTTSPMASVKSTVSDPHKGIKLTIKLDRFERPEKTDKYKEKEYKHGRKRKQSGRSPRESSRSPWEFDNTGDVRHKADSVYQFEPTDNTTKTTSKRLSVREAELLEEERPPSQPKITLKLTKSKLKGASTSQGSPSYS